MNNTSIRDVAKLAKVSIATVSRCINAPDQVREEKRKRVQDAIVKLGYSPNTLARDFRRGSTKIVIVVVPSIGNPFFSVIMQGIFEAASSEGYSIMMKESSSHELDGVEVSDLIFSRQADGIILLASLSPYGTEVLSARSERAVPIVIGCEVVSKELEVLPSVCIDNVAAAQGATEYLISQGHTKISFIFGHNSSLLTADREKGYRKAMSEAGLAIEDGWVVEGKMSILGAQHATRKLINHDNRPTAIFCANDEMALGCLHELKVSGIAVPEDISVMGFDDIRYAEVSSPPLTTIAQPMLEIGERVFFSLMREMKQGVSKANVEPELVPHKLIIRDSVAKVPD